MFKGEISNQPALLCMLDYHILTRGSIRLKLKDGAKDWVARNWKYRFGVFIVSDAIILSSRLPAQVKRLVKDFIPEVWSFKTKEEFRLWVDVNVERITRVYTNDPALLGLEEFIQKHTGWTEKL